MYTQTTCLRSVIYFLNNGENKDNPDNSYRGIFNVRKYKVSLLHEIYKRKYSGIYKKVVKVSYYLKYKYCTKNLG